MTDFSYESKHQGIVCGLDEVGRGPLAGPVVAGGVIIPEDKRELDFIADINDSKKLSKKKREYLYDKIMEHFPCTIIEISPQEIDEINILQASLKAMKLACEELLLSSRMNVRDLNFHALVDGNKAPALACTFTAVIKGDSKSKSIAAASIIAKVHRDRIMKKLDKEHPHYGWANNSGYPTAQHRAAIEQFGITEHHRKSFKPVRLFIDMNKL